MTKHTHKNDEQLKQFSMAVELLPHPSFDPQSPLWLETKALIEERAWQPFDQARHR